MVANSSRLDEFDIAGGAKHEHDCILRASILAVTAPLLASTTCSNHILNTP